jgi:UDP-glucose:(heptosyl)LPS alpha-1,3-glucosyltransferase
VNLAICHPFVIPARGGAETYVADLCRRLSAAGHEVHLYACAWDASALPAAVHCHRVAIGGWPRFLRPWRFSAALAKRIPPDAHDLTIGFDKVAGVDVCYPLGGLYGATVRYGRGKTASPLLRALAAAVRAADVAHRSFVAFERHQYRGARPPFVIAPSAFVQRHFAEDLGVPAGEVQVLHCAIDPERFAATDRPARRDRARRAWGVGPNDVVALFVAMNYRLKGLDPLLRAVAVLPRREAFKLVVIGHPKTAPHQKLADRLRASDRVVFAGFHADPRDAYFGADLLVHPTFYDPCSLVVLEAQACGLPVITSAHNGAAELLDAGTDGLVVKDPHDREELAAALLHYLDPARRQQAARAALRNSQRWTFELHHRRLVALLREALVRKLAA